MNSNSKLSLNLFWKFTIALVGTVALFGIINIYLINYAIYDIFDNELSRYGSYSARSIAERCVDPIVYDDIATLNKIVTQQAIIDSSIAYIFILNSEKEVLAHTMEYDVPQSLIEANSLKDNQRISITRIINSEKPDIIIRDILIPVLDGSIGFVRIGFLEQSYLKSSKRTTRIFIIMVSIFLIFGIFGAFFFSYVITTPIKIISNTAKKIELGEKEVNLNDLDIRLPSSTVVKWKNVFSFNDEIDDLISSFDDMVKRLFYTYGELQKVQNSLFQSEKMASLGTLSAGLAHEINNPISGLQNCVRRIKESPDNISQNMVYLEMMEEAVNKIGSVVGGLLNFARKPEFHFREVYLNDIIDNVIKLIKYRLEKNRIAIIKEYKQKRFMISCSPNHIEQVFLNLMINSIDAIESKMEEKSGYQGEIRITLGKKDDNLIIEVVDNGGGVEDNHLQEIFDPFFTMKNPDKGTGLGLAVSFKIIEQHNGKITAKNNNMGGLSVLIHLPEKVQKQN